MPLPENYYLDLYRGPKNLADIPTVPDILHPTPDVSVIGTDHFANFKQLTGQAGHRAFLEEIKSAKYLAIEGTRNGQSKIQAGFPSSYEALTMRLFPGRNNVIYLEEGSNGMQSTLEYGISAHEVGMYMGIMTIAKFIAGKGRFKTFKEFVASDIQNTAGSVSGFDSYNTDRVVDELNRMYQSIDQHVHLGLSRDQILTTFVDAFSIFIWYLRAKDDVVTLIPNSLHFVHNAPGKKIIMAGKEHSKPIADAIKENQVPTLLPWQIFLERALNQESLDKVRFFEEFAKLR